MNRNVPKSGTIIEITARHCSEKQQTRFTVGSRFIAADSSQLCGDGSLQIVVKHPSKKNATLTFNTKRIEYIERSTEYLMQERMRQAEVEAEKAFKKKVADDVQTMLHKFTKREHYQITLVPLILTELAFVYAEKVHKFCAEHRISEVKKLGRAVKHLREEYLNFLRKDLDEKHIRRISDETEQFMQEHSYDFLVLWVQASNIIANQFRGIEYENMRIDALIGREFVSVFKEYNRDMNKKISERMGGAKEIRYPHQEKLWACLDAYLGAADKVKRSENYQLDLAFRAIRNRLMSQDFSIINE